MLTLKGAFSTNPKVSAVGSWCCPSEGRRHSLADHLQNPGELFAAQLRDNAFDVFEFSISDYVIVSLQAFRPLAMDSHPHLS